MHYRFLRRIFTRWGWMEPPPVAVARPGVKCTLCSKRFGTEQAMRDHRHGKHGVRGRVTPKRLWPHD